MVIISYFCLFTPKLFASEIGVGLSRWGIFDSDYNNSVSLTYETSELDFYRLKVVGLWEHTSDNHDYISIGILRSYKINNDWSFGGGFQAGYLDRDELLGENIEFYSRAFINYQATNSVKVRLALGHISNGGIGERNPGSESISLTFLHGL